MKQIRKTTTVLETREDLVSFFKIDNWDVLIIGDGSAGGSGGCGWAAAMLDRFTGIWKIASGGNSFGSIGVAEIMGTWFLLKYHHSQLRERKQKYPYQVHILSDNMSIVMAGRANRNERSSKNEDIWRAIDWLSRAGLTYDLKYHWIPEDVVITTHQLMDQLASSARQYARNLQESALPDLCSFLT